MVWVLIYWLRRSKRKYRYPPGPRGLPVLGNLLQVGNLPWETFTEWGKTYGGLITVKMGMKKWVIVNSPRAMKQLIMDRGALWSDRPQDYVTDNYARGGMGLLFTKLGPKYNLYRQVAWKALSKTAVDAYQPLMDYEASVCMRTLAQLDGASIDPYVTFDECIIRTMITVAIGQIMEPHDPAVQTVVHHHEEMKAEFSFTRRWPDLFPLLSFLSGKHVKRVIAKRDRFEAFWQARINTLKQSIKEGSDVPCFAGMILKDPAAKISEIELIQLLNLIIAASDTTATAMTSLVIILASHPEIQERAAAEIEEVFGTDALPHLDDSVDLPYMSCVLKELLRYRTPNYFGAGHALAKDDTFDFEGQTYSLPKDTFVLTNIHALHMANAKYTNPWQFDPTRHESSAQVPSSTMAKGPFDERDHYAFGTGRRACTGMILAERELLTLAVRMLWAFRIAFATDADGREIKVDPLGAVYESFAHALPCQLHFYKRHEGVDALLQSA
ncbi:hypothetical protein BZG36_01931 [Bifiguratus adelaidae]|uniref:Cytochrome P450 n=1 Tax=Bifiguratus adelaidae TaxID=1938954 RepID=A0A261Y3Y2_9FUNG|nr:hypothetical protein BZG36_01931 [Bifiguratus adelaidae]